MCVVWLVAEAKESSAVRMKRCLGVSLDAGLAWSLRCDCLYARVSDGHPQHMAQSAPLEMQCKSAWIRTELVCLRHTVVLCAMKPRELMAVQRYHRLHTLAL